MATLNAVPAMGVTPGDLTDVYHFERGVLGCCIRADEDADGGTLDDVAAALAPDDFGHWPHRLTFEAMLQLRAAAVPATRVTLFDRLKGTGGLADLGEAPARWLADLYDAQPTAALTSYFVGKVKDASRRRALKRAHAEMHGELQSPGLDADELAARCERLIFDASDGAGPATGPRPIGDLVREELHALDGRVSGAGPVGLGTGFGDLDRLVCGMRAGQLVVVGARPGVGKTALALEAANHVSGAGVPVLLASLEMPAAELTQRLLAMRAGVPLAAIRSGRLTPGHVDRLTDARPALDRLPLHIDDTPTVTADRLAAAARRAVRWRGVGLLVVDYLQLLTPDDPRANRNAQITALSRRLKLLARECGIPVLVLSQLNRESEGRPDPRPRLSDLRDSGAIEQDADVVLLLHPQKGGDPDARALLVDVLVAKNRNGPRGEVTLTYTRALTRFEDAPCAVPA